MASISQIPFPKSGIDVFGEGMNRMFSDLMKRQQMAQQRGIKREELGQAHEHFLQQQELAKQTQNRLNQMLPYQIQAWKDAHAKLDPNYEINQYKALEDWVKGQSQQGGGSQGDPQEAPPYGQIGAPPQQSIPTQEMGQGLGMFSPEGMKNAQQPPPVTTPAAPQTATAGAPNMGGLNLELLKAHPILRGFAKKHLGFDPLAAVPQTPEEKQAAALELFKQKEGVKAQNKGGDTPTNTVLTQNQQALQGIDTVLPMIDEMIKHPEKVYGRSDFDRSKRAAYNAKTSGMIDTLIAAQQLPKVQASIDLVEQQIRRGTGESTPAYIERLKDLRKDLAARKVKALSVVKSRKVNTNAQDDISTMSDDQLRQLAGGG